MSTTTSLFIFATLLLLLSKTPALSPSAATYYFIGAVLRQCHIGFDRIFRPSPVALLLWINLLGLEEWYDWGTLAIVFSCWCCISSLMWIHSLIKRLQDNACVRKTVNACAMGHCLITLYQATGEQQYHDILMSKIAYLRKDALRFGDHVLQHTVSANNDFPEQCWCDTLFMAAFLMLRVGVMEHDEELIDDALNQYYWHIKYLQNPSSGLWYHGYDNIAGDHMSGIYWGRANAWAAFTMSQVGGILPQCYLYPKYIDVAGSLNEQLAALKVYQTENGLWRTVVDDPESYEEISASAGIAAAMLTRGNPLHSKYINKAIKGLLANVSEDGKVMNSPDGDREAGYPAYYGEGRREGGSIAFRIRRDPSRRSYHSGRDYRMAE